MVVVAAGVAAKGAKKAGSAAANNPAMTILLGVVGLLVVTNMIRGTRGAVVGGAKKAGGWAAETFKRGAFEYQLYPGGPQGDLRNLPAGARDFVRGIFTPQDTYQDTYVSEDEMPVGPVIVPRATPTNRAADYGQSAGKWFFNISPIGTNWQYDLRRLPGTIRDIF